MNARQPRVVPSRNEMAPLRSVTPQDSEAYRLSHVYLRLMMLFLPGLLFLVVVMAAFTFRSLEESISAYYRGNFRDILVGVLFALAACMIAYKGDLLEDFALNTAGFAALFVALVPENLRETLRAPDADRDALIASLRISLIAVLVVTAAFVWVDRRSGLWARSELAKRKGPRRLSQALGVAAVLFIGLVLWRLVEGHEFAGVHLSAAVLLIAGLAVAVASYAWPEQMAITCSGEEKADRRGYHGWYRIIFWLMALGLPALLIGNVIGFAYTVIAVEAWEIALFFWFWVVETVRGQATP